MKDNIISWIKINTVHILMWTVFILYETLIVGIVFNIFANPIIYILHYIVIICFFYFVANSVLPWCIKKRGEEFWHFPIAFLAVLVIYVGMQFGADLILIAIKILPYKEGYGFDSQFILKNIYRAFYFIGFATAYYFLKSDKEARKIQEELKELHLLNIIKHQKTEQDLYKSQNAFLKAQINPHFLFNTLDFIYYHIGANSEIASHAIILLSKMMRYAIDANKKGDFIMLGEEIQQCENLLYLYQLRKNYDLKIDFNYALEVMNITIIPLVLLTLVENMIKHGEFNDENGEASISLYTDDENLYIQTDNLIKERAADDQAHTGLSNISERLKYTYGERMSFDYHIDKGRFYVELVIRQKY